MSPIFRIRLLDLSPFLLPKFIEANTPDAEIIDTAYLSALSRFPNDSEKQRLIAFLTEAPAVEKRIVIEDLFWSVFTSKEFLFQH